MNRALVPAGVLALALLATGCPSGTEGLDAGATGPDAAACRSQCGEECCAEGEVCNVSLLQCEPPCAPSCLGRLCGDDGCGGSCGTCGEGTRCESGGCVVCLAQCLGKECGWDGCSGSCGECPGGFACTAFQCVPDTAPDAGSVADGGGALDAGLPDLSLADFCSRLVDFQVSRNSECSGGPPAAWAALISKSRQCGLLQDSVGGGLSVYEASKAAGCLGWYQTASCQQIQSYPEGNPCEQVLRGRVALGGGCYSAIDCAEGYCAASPQSCPGVCTAYVPEGEACTATDLCARGNSCANGTCRPFAGQGEPCGGPTGVVCAWPEYFCEGPSGTEPGTCLPKSTSGACSQYDACDLRYHCEGFVPYPLTSGTCTRKRAVGESCAPGARECEQFSYCADTGTCALWGSPGEACGMVGAEYANCLSSWCQTDATYQGACTAFKSPGESCLQTEGGACGFDGACDPVTERCLPACTAP